MKILNINLENMYISLICTSVIILQCTVQKKNPYISKLLVSTNIE